MLGTTFDEIVNESGRLFLVYWDSNNGDNFGFVTASLDVNPSSTVPTPGGLLLLGTALLALGASRRDRRR